MTKNRGFYTQTLLTSYIGGVRVCAFDIDVTVTSALARGDVGTSSYIPIYLPYFSAAYGGKQKHIFSIVELKIPIFRTPTTAQNYKFMTVNLHIFSESKFEYPPNEFPSL